MSKSHAPNPLAEGRSSAVLARLRDLNDDLRIHGRGGIVLFTDGIAALDASTVRLIMAAITSFDDFNPDDDPFGEHDCALLTVAGIRILWKIDYYDRSRCFQSPDPANAKITVRFLTIMRADEY